MTRTYLQRLRDWNIHTIYLHHHPFVAALSAEAVNAAHTARQAGLAAVAMAGDPAWTTDPATVTRWVRAVTSTGAYTGVHLDIEAHHHPDYGHDSAGIYTAWVRTLAAAAAATHLPVTAAVPWWYPPSVVQAGAATVDSIDLITYHSDAAVVAGYIAGNTAALAAAGKPWRAAIETTPTPATPWLSTHGSTA